MSQYLCSRNRLLIFKKGLLSRNVFKRSPSNASSIKGHIKKKRRRKQGERRRQERTVITVINLRTTDLRLTEMGDPKDSVYR